MTTDSLIPSAPDIGPPGEGGDFSGVRCPACNQVPGVIRCTGAGLIGGYPPGLNTVSQILGPCPNGYTGERQCTLCLGCLELQPLGCAVEYQELERKLGGEMTSGVERERQRRGLH